MDIYIYDCRYMPTGTCSCLAVYGPILPRSSFRAKAVALSQPLHRLLLLAGRAIGRIPMQRIYIDMEYLR